MKQKAKGMNNEPGISNSEVFSNIFQYSLFLVDIFLIPKQKKLNQQSAKSLLQGAEGVLGGCKLHYPFPLFRLNRLHTQSSQSHQVHIFKTAICLYLI